MRHTHPPIGTQFLVAFIKTLCAETVSLFSQESLTNFSKQFLTKKHFIDGELRKW